MPHRKTLTSMENGLRTLNIASLNPDSMKEATTQQEIINELTKNKIHIAMIQETHIAKDLNYIMGNYRIITSAAEKQGNGSHNRRNCNNDTRGYPTKCHTNQKTKQQIHQSNTWPGKSNNSNTGNINNIDGVM